MTGIQRTATIKKNDVALSMKPSRTTRLVAALIAAISLLFTQLALASYVCPGMTMPAAMTTAVEDDMQDMSGCTGMDMQQPALCHAHDHVGQQSLDKPDVPQVAPFAVAGLTLLVPPLDTVTPTTAPPSNATLLTRTTAPPLAIRHCCFRI